MLLNTSIYKIPFKSRQVLFRLMRVLPLIVWLHFTLYFSIGTWCFYFAQVLTPEWLFFFLFLQHFCPLIKPYALLSLLITLTDSYLQLITYFIHYFKSEDKKWKRKKRIVWLSHKEWGLIFRTYLVSNKIEELFFLMFWWHDMFQTMIRFGANEIRSKVC